VSKALLVIKKQSPCFKNFLFNWVPFRFRYGQEFSKTFHFLTKSEKWNTDKLREHQTTELKKLLIHSYETVEYYNGLFKEYGFDPYKFKYNDEIKRLPFLTKDIINNNFKSLISSRFKDKKLFKFKTSGSTGKKLMFLGDDNVFKKEAAFILRAYRNHGGTLYDKPSIWLRRYVPEAATDALWMYDHELRRLYMSPYHLTIDNLKDYLMEMSRKKYHTLVGYPSSLFIFALLLEDSGLEPPKVKAIHAASEKMLPEWSRKIKEVFGIEVKCHYGMMEKVSFMHQKMHSEDYYDNLEYGLTEIDHDGSIIGTGFLNYAMPFIRYKTNDFAIKIDKKTDVGLPVIAKEILGRSDDFLITASGSRVPPVNFYTMMYKIDSVKMFQIKQKKDLSLEVKVVLEKSVSESLDKVKQNLSKRLGSIRIKIEVVDQIKRDSKTNKIRCIINENK
jgi:phenylacetate-CoA ligase